MDNDFNPNAYKQAYVIINYLVNCGEIAVSQELLDNIEYRMNDDYYFDINDIKRHELLFDTEKILTVIYLDCLLPEKKKDKVLELTQKIKNIITDNKKSEKELVPIDLSGLSLFEKLKIKLSQLMKYRKLDDKEQGYVNKG